MLGACAVLAVAGGWAWWGGSTPGPAPTGPQAPPARTASNPFAPVAAPVTSGPAARESLAHLEDAGQPLPQPWEVTRDNAPPPPRGHTPAYQVRPPPPDAARASSAPVPVPRPDPASTRPPMDNPGGVNGDRPPRPVPGLE